MGIVWEGEGGSRLIWNTYPFLGLYARARDAPHQSTDKGRSASVHAKKNRMGRRQHTTKNNGQTQQLLDRIGPVGRFGEKPFIIVLSLIGWRMVYHGWTEFCYAWLQLDQSECLGQSVIWTSLNGELWQLLILNSPCWGVLAIFILWYIVNFHLQLWRDCHLQRGSCFTMSVLGFMFLFFWEEY